MTGYKFIQVTTNTGTIDAIFGTQYTSAPPDQRTKLDSNVRSYLLFATSRSMLHVVFGATLAGDVAQIDFMCRNSHLNMYNQHFKTQQIFPGPLINTQ